MLNEHATTTSRSQHPATPQTWPDWLAAAFAHLEEANGARKRLTAAMADGASESADQTLIEEYRARA